MRRLLPAALGALAACAASTTDAPGPAAGFGAGTTSFLQPAAEEPVAQESALPVLSAQVLSAQMLSAAGESLLAPESVATEPTRAALAPTALEATNGEREAGPLATASPTVAAAADPGGVRDEGLDGDTLRGRERALRDRLRGADKVGAALELAALLCEFERLGEAAGILERVAAESHDPLCSVALAGVQRDLGQRHLATAGLRDLREEQGALSLHPGLLFELAELEWLEGDGPAARRTLAELRRVHDGDAWLRENDRKLRAFENELETAGSPQRLAVRDLLGNLRGAPSPQERLRTFDALLALARAEGATPTVRALERRVLAIGAADESAAVRARAVQSGPVQSAVGLDRELFLIAAQADVDPFVRRMACTRTVELLGREAPPLLLAQLADESDPATFAAIHAALRRLAEGKLAESTLAEDALAGDKLAREPARIIASTPELRAETVAAWQKRWGKLGWQ